MKIKAHETGQALILIVFGIVALVGLTGLAIDGGNAYSDRRSAQNAADAAALAGALAHAKSRNVTSAAQAVAATNGYNNNDTSNTVAVSTAASPAGICPGNAVGEDITVQITSKIQTFFAPVVGIQHISNTVIAVARSCDTYIAPPFNGNAIVALAPSGTAYSATGTPVWNVTGGGIFSNSSSSAAATCNGAAGVNAPSVTTAGGISFDCHTVNITNGTTTNVQQYIWSDYESLMPPTPQCDGVAYKGSDGLIHEQAGKAGRGSTIPSWDSLGGNYSPGVYCITGTGGNIHTTITGTGVVFYFSNPNYSSYFNGGGGLQASAPLSGLYGGVLIYMAPQVVNGVLQQTQSLGLYGNGNADIIGAIIAPSANVTMYGNSGTGGYDCQIIGYTVTSGGTADITINYDAGNNYQTTQPITLSLIR